MRTTSAESAIGARLSSRPVIRPVLFVIDDEPGVMHTLRDDLGRRFGRDFRIIGESSPAAGLARLREMAGLAPTGGTGRRRPPDERDGRS